MGEGDGRGGDRGLGKGILVRSGLGSLGMEGRDGGLRHDEKR